MTLTRELVATMSSLLLLTSLSTRGQAPTTGPATSPIKIDWAARALQPGEILVFTLSFETEPSAVRLRIFDRDVAAFRVDERTWRAVAGIDLARQPGTYPAEVRATTNGSTIRGSASFDVAAKRFPTRTLTVNPDFVNPPASLLPRIAEERAFMNGVLSRSAPDRLWNGTFARPVTQAANSAFGTSSVFNGERRNPHTGADFLSPAGTPVRAPIGGRVVAARPQYFSGNTVVLDHGLEMFSMLLHLSRIDVREGDMVTTGHVVGLAGATGRVTGAHLHWSLTVAGARVDPLSALAVLGDEKP
jgi:murein DD-endopeptidase MepM/ murein hydrolase activator NlpD